LAKAFFAEVVNVNVPEFTESGSMALMDVEIASGMQ
jgi:hypothetical protein